MLMTKFNRVKELSYGCFSPRNKREQDESEYGVPKSYSYLEAIEFLKYNPMAPHSYDGNDVLEETAWNARRLPLKTNLLIKNNGSNSVRVGDALCLTPPRSRDSGLADFSRDPGMFEAQFDTFPIVVTPRMRRRDLEERVIPSLVNLVLGDKPRDDSRCCMDTGLRDAIMKTILEICYHHASLVKVLWVLLKRHHSLGSRTVDDLYARFDDNDLLKGLATDHLAFGTNLAADTGGDRLAAANSFRDSLSTCLEALNQIHDIWYPVSTLKVKTLNSTLNEPKTRVMCRLRGNGDGISAEVAACIGDSEQGKLSANKEFVSVLHGQRVSDLVLPPAYTYRDMHALVQTLDVNVASDQLANAISIDKNFVTARVTHTGPDGDIDATLDSSVVLMPKRRRQGFSLNLETRSKRRAESELRESFVAFANEVVSAEWPHRYGPCPCSKNICETCKESIACNVYIGEGNEAIVDLFHLFVLCDAASKLSGKLGSSVRTHLTSRGKHLGIRGDPEAVLKSIDPDTHEVAAVNLQMSRIATAMKNLFCSKHPEVVGKLASVYANNRKSVPDGLVFCGDDMSLQLI